MNNITGKRQGQRISHINSWYAILVPYSKFLLRALAEQSWYIVYFVLFNMSQWLCSYKNFCCCSGTRPGTGSSVIITTTIGLFTSLRSLLYLFLVEVVLCLLWLQTWRKLTLLACPVEYDILDMTWKQLQLKSMCFLGSVYVMPLNYMRCVFLVQNYSIAHVGYLSMAQLYAIIVIEWFHFSKLDKAPLK